ncbi:MAG TPA: cytochrome c [Pelovirga sp.]|nr:cytochrome c [Pelovirga sp.]
MRHFLGNIAIYLIIVFLVGAATFFAWMRSSQIVISNEETVIARFDTSSGRQFNWSQLGEHSYLRNCANCHGSDGQGWGQYPALNHTPLLFISPQGRSYIIDLHIYGLTSSRWAVPMPPMGHIQDIEMASVINYVLTQFGNEETINEDGELLRPPDIAERRGQNLSPKDVNGRRPN